MTSSDKNRKEISSTQLLKDFYNGTFLIDGYHTIQDLNIDGSVLFNEPLNTANKGKVLFNNCSISGTIEFLNTQFEELRFDRSHAEEVLVNYAGESKPCEKLFIIGGEFGKITSYSSGKVLIASHKVYEVVIYDPDSIVVTAESAFDPSRGIFLDPLVVTFEEKIESLNINCYKTCELLNIHHVQVKSLQVAGVINKMDIGFFKSSKFILAGVTCTESMKITQIEGADPARFEIERCNFHNASFELIDFNTFKWIRISNTQLKDCHFYSIIWKKTFFQKKATILIGNQELFAHTENGTVV